MKLFTNLCLCFFGITCYSQKPASSSKFERTEEKKIEVITNNIEKESNNIISNRKDAVAPVQNNVLTTKEELEDKNSVNPASSKKVNESK